MLLETNKLELKERVTSNIVKEVIAFANTLGGKIQVGASGYDGDSENDKGDGW